MILLNGRRFEWSGPAAVSLRSPSRQFFVVADNTSDVLDDRGNFKLRGLQYHGRDIADNFYALIRDHATAIVVGELNVTEEQASVVADAVSRRMTDSVRYGEPS